MKWSDILEEDTLYLSDGLAKRALEERAAGKAICPPQDCIFRALTLTPPDKVKVCIVGQDPYHTPGQANGLAFSVAPDAPLQPSLKNIFKELQEDIGCGTPPNGDLTAWAERGVLLLNTSLTVYEHQANSHASWGWQFFTKDVLNTVNGLSQPVVFILWGANAQDLKWNLMHKGSKQEGNVITHNSVNKAIILSSHPSPFSANKPCRDTPPFRGSKPFSKANELLEKMGSEPIDWRL